MQSGKNVLKKAGENIDWQRVVEMSRDALKEELLYARSCKRMKETPWSGDYWQGYIDAIERALDILDEAQETAEFFAEEE